MILFLGYVQLCFAEEPSNSSEMDVPAQNRNSNFLRVAKRLKPLYEVITLGFVYGCCPVVFEICATTKCKRRFSFRAI